MLSLIAFLGIANAQITSVEDLSNEKVYTIIPKDATRGALYATSTSTYLTACGGTRNAASNPSIAIDATSKDQQFAFYTYDGKMYLFSVGAQKFVNDDNSTNFFTLTEKPLQPVAVVASDTQGYFIVKANGSEFVNVSTGWDHGAVGGWNSTDDGNRMEITAVADMDGDTKAALEAIFNTQANITVNHVCNDKTIFSEVVTMEKGTAIADTEITTISRVGLVYSSKTGTTETVENNTVITVTYTIDNSAIPFTVSTLESDGSFGAGMVWYNITNARNPIEYLSYDPTNNINIFATEKATDAKRMYAFTGNPADGFKIYNYFAGADKQLWSSSVKNNESVKMTDNASVTAGSDWILEKNNDKGYQLRKDGSATGYLNDVENKLGYWDYNLASTDDGSTVNFTLDPDATALIEAAQIPIVKSALQNKINELNAYVEASGVNPGEILTEETDKLKQPLEDAQAIIDANSTTYSDYTNAIEALNTAFAQADITKTNPVTEGTYMIVSANTSKKVQVAMSCYGYTETWGPVSYSPAWAELDVNNPWQYWTLEENGDGFSIKATNEGKYITSLSTFTETAAVATFTLLGNAQYNIFLGESATPVHTNGWNWSGETSGGLIEYDGGVNTASAWKLVKVTSEPTLKHTLAMSDAGWATLHVGFNTIIPEGVKCYTVSGLEGNYAVLKEVTDVLPANTPVLVQRNEGNTNTSFAFNYTAESGDAVGNNELRGSHFRSKVTPAENTTYYVLAIGENGVGLYKDELSNDFFRNNANKAYLPVVAEAGANAAASYSFNFDWAGTTGIEGVVAEGTQDGAIYDITGRRVKAITAPGIYIVNGRKVVK